VPKYDAFGREIGDDPLKSLREVSNPVPAEETSRVEVSAPEAEPETEAWSGTREPEPDPQRIVVAAPPEFVRPRRRRRGFPAFLVLGVIVAAVGLVANSAVEKGENLIDDISTALPEAAEPEEQAPPPVGLEPDSLIREDNFAAALKTLADSGLGRPTALRIAPERIDTQLLEGNTLHIVQITPDGELHEFGSSEGTGRPLAFKAIDPAAPERLVRRAATPKAPPRNINYLVVSPGPPQSVGAYFKNGRIVIGDAHGRPERVL
jgi:hypothetical protein